MPSSKIVTTTPRPVMFLRHTGPTLMSNPRGPIVCPVEDKNTVIYLLASLTFFFNSLGKNLVFNQDMWSCFR